MDIRELQAYGYFILTAFLAITFYAYFFHLYNFSAYEGTKN